MFLAAFLIGLYSYFIFFLGITQKVNKEIIIIVGLTVIFTIAFSLFRSLSIKEFKKLILSSKISFLLLVLLLLVNLVGVLGPEIAFDALWYHLTLPKLYLAANSIFHIPGGLFYYSDMPKLTEMLYLASLSVSSETTAKFIHFFFGLLTLLVIYKISRKFLSIKFSVIASLIYYSNLVVLWESITAYVDLSRAFFESLSLLAILNYLENNQKRWLVVTGVMLGLSITVKLLSVITLIIFLALIFLFSRRNLRSKISELVIITFCALLIPLPWLVFSYLNTGNPVYPFFTAIYSIVPQTNFGNYLTDLVDLFIFNSDPISPIYLAFLPLIIISFKKFPKGLKFVSAFCILAIVFWLFTPRTGGGRFILPYLPAFSIIAAAAVYEIRSKKLLYYFLILIYLVGFSSFLYRGVANYKFVPVVFGKETKELFLYTNLNNYSGTVYDSTLNSKIGYNDKVLVIGGHNLYYLNFYFVHESFVKKGMKFNYLLTIDSILPEKYVGFELVYQNNNTKVKLYKTVKDWLWIK